MGMRCGPGHEYLALFDQVDSESLMMAKVSYGIYIHQRVKSANTRSNGLL